MKEKNYKCLIRQGYIYVYAQEREWMWNRKMIKGNTIVGVHLGNMLLHILLQKLEEQKTIGGLNIT